jgi:sarcosine reductase
MGTANVKGGLSMRLELADYKVTRIEFGAQTRLNGTTLIINKEEIKGLVLSDARIADVDIHLVERGENTRITQVRDIIEPRTKVNGGGQVYPGFVGSRELVGQGTTNRLAGALVIVSAGVPHDEAGGGHRQFSDTIVDISGPGALTAASDSENVVLVIKADSNCSYMDYVTAIQSAGLKVANRLAGTTLELTADNVECFELPPVDPSLPKVVYFLGVHTTAHDPHPGTTFYGLPLREVLPFWVHPNEMIDGAFLSKPIIGSQASHSAYEWATHPVVLSMCRRHGKDINFLGVIFQRIRYETMEGKILAATQAAKLAKQLNADGAVITWYFSGNAFVDVMLTTQACERQGIKVVTMTPEYSNLTGKEYPLVFTVPEAVSVVSTGNCQRFQSEGPIKLPAVDKVVGAEEIKLDPSPGAPKMSAYGEFEISYLLRPLVGAIDKWGARKVTTREY